MGRPRGGRGPPGESRNEAPSRSSASLAPSSLVEGPPSMEDPRLDHSASSLSRLASYLFPHSRFLSPPRVFSSAALSPSSLVEGPPSMEDLRLDHSAPALL